LVGNLQDILTIEDFNVDTSDSLFDSSTLPDINFSDDGTSGSGGNDTPDYNPLLE